MVMASAVPPSDSWTRTLSEEGLLSASGVLPSGAFFLPATFFAVQIALHQQSEDISFGRSKCHLFEYLPPLHHPLCTCCSARGATSSVDYIKLARNNNVKLSTFDFWTIRPLNDAPCEAYCIRVSGAFSMKHVTLSKGSKTRTTHSLSILQLAAASHPIQPTEPCTGDCDCCTPPWKVLQRPRPHLLLPWHGHR